MRSPAPGYDLFKLIVSVLLLAILIFIVLRGCNTSQVPAAVSATSETNPIVIASLTSVPATALPTATSAMAASTVAPTLTAQPASPTPTGTGPAAAAVDTQTADSLGCGTILPSRLLVGGSARVMRNLNMRQAPEITAPLLQTNRTGTQAQVIDGPVCTPQGGSAYLWWKIRLGTGAEGWSAETPLNNRSYFLEPVVP
jgi:hypothetical protein